MIDMVIAEDQAMLRDSLACAIDMQDDMHVSRPSPMLPTPFPRSRSTTQT